MAHVRLFVRASPHHWFTGDLMDGAERLLTNSCSCHQRALEARMENQNGIDWVQRPSGDKRLLPRRTMQVPLSPAGIPGSAGAALASRGTAEDGWTDGWMECPGLSKLKPAEVKPPHCQGNKQQQCR